MNYLKIEIVRYLSYFTTLNVPEWEIYLDKKGDVYTSDIFSTNNIRIIQSYLHRNDFNGKMCLNCNENRPHRVHGKYTGKINVMMEAVRHSSIETMKLLKDIGYEYTCRECINKNSACDNHEINYNYIDTAIHIGSVDKLKYLHSIGIYCRDDIFCETSYLLENLDEYDYPYKHHKDAIEYILFDCGCSNLEYMVGAIIDSFARVEYADILCRLYYKELEVRHEDILYELIEELHRRVEELEKKLEKVS